MILYSGYCYVFSFRHNCFCFFNGSIYWRFILCISAFNHFRVGVKLKHVLFSPQNISRPPQQPRQHRGFLLVKNKISPAPYSAVQSEVQISPALYSAVQSEAAARSWGLIVFQSAKLELELEANPVRRLTHARGGILSNNYQIVLLGSMIPP